MKKLQGTKCWLDVGSPIPGLNDDFGGNRWKHLWLKTPDWHPSKKYRQTNKGSALWSRAMHMLQRSERWPCVLGVPYRFTTPVQGR